MIKIHNKASKLFEKDPKAAINYLKDIKPNKKIPNFYIKNLKASIFVDGGSIIKDKDTIENGIQIFRELFENDSGNASYAYNLANGLLSYSQVIDTRDNEWFLNTFKIRKEARKLYDLVGSSRTEASIKSQAMTNLGNIFLRSQRALEAYESYKEALEYDPENGIAATGAVKILFKYIQYGLGDIELLKNAAAKLIKQANINRNRIVEYSSQQALEELDEILNIEIETKNDEIDKDLSGYERFVYLHRLALSPAIESVDVSIKRWDSLRIESIIEPFSTDSTVPPIFTMFNTLKSEYLTARLLTYQAFETEVTESGYYSDTLDYANYGTKISILTLAQRACIDILDKIAIATSEYFNWDGNRRRINFYNRWFKKNNGEIVNWADQILEEINKNNYTLIALTELSEDMGKDGFLEIKKELRNASTHRFVILHEGMLGDSRESDCIEHYVQDDFMYELISTLRTVRSALFYFVEMISINEFGKKKDGNLSAALWVPGHHHIRGDDDE